MAATTAVSRGPDTVDFSGSSLAYQMDAVPMLDPDNEFFTTKIYHGVSIVSGEDEANKTVIGRIQSWQPDSYTREGVHLYELSALQWGRPVEYIPGKATGYTIAVTRAEVWNAEMERAFFNTNKTLYVDLIDQDTPFNVKEFWIRGDDADAYTIWTYHGCWFQNKNMDAITSDGDGITRISAQLAYVSKTGSGSGFDGT